MGKESTVFDSKAKTRPSQRTARPRLFRVLMHNDDYTTMEFVVEMLERIFRKSPVEANLIMLQIHHRGQGVCGVYPHDIAETKIGQVHDLARTAGYPLRCSLDEA